MITHVRLWDKQLVECTVLRDKWFLRLTAYRIKHIGKYEYITTEIRWYPSWRIVEISNQGEDKR